MSIDYSRVTALSDHIGNIVKVTDAAGNVLWAAGGGKVILEVEKITSDTYAGETTYTGEQFIMLDIYPKTNGTVSVTYGGLTKTITDTSGAAEPNAQQVYFGTFNGVLDSVATPASGELTIEGDFVGFGTSHIATSSKVSNHPVGCVTSVVDITCVEILCDMAFASCEKITGVTIPDNITSIGAVAFGYCSGLVSITIPGSVTYIGNTAFIDCSGLANVIVLATTPPVLGNEYVFDGSTCPITVPKGCGEVYKTADYWSEYAGRIVEAS